MNKICGLWICGGICMLTICTAGICRAGVQPGNGDKSCLSDKFCDFKPVDLKLDIKDFTKCDGKGDLKDDKGDKGEKGFCKLDIKHTDHLLCDVKDKDDHKSCDVKHHDDCDFGDHCAPVCPPPCDPASVPAPASAAFGGVGLLGIMLMGLRKRAICKA
jgi:hypothetical protein